MELTKVQKKKIKKFVVDYSRQLIESITNPIPKGLDFDEALRQQDRRSDKAQIYDLKEAKQIYEIVKDW